MTGTEPLFTRMELKGRPEAAQPDPLCTGQPLHLRQCEIDPTDHFVQDYFKASRSKLGLFKLAASANCVFWDGWIDENSCGESGSSCNATAAEIAHCAMAPNLPPAALSWTAGSTATLSATQTITTAFTSQAILVLLAIAGFTPQQAGNGS
ncbi:hypothetical protein ABT083_31530 [Streptomyces goshikiensis]|uniref:hypothetical protein n=1 Tax=Streptomyces goshikiensis TaxID=1942 RepID=UPI00331CEB38